MLYTSYEKPLQIETGTANVKFFYNADRKRFERVDYDKQTQTTSTTLYLGNYELVSHQSPQGRTIEMKIYAGPNTELVIRHDGQNISSNVYELLRDSLGSVTGITGENGNVIQRFSYTPFGEQIKISNSSQEKSVGTSQDLSAVSKQTGHDLSLQQSGDYPITHQGFTGQEEVEPVGLIHMNGRMYDPTLGRFLSADPNIQDLSNSQSLNRYSYCMNNPLAFTDPTGFFSMGHFFNKLFASSAARIGAGVIVGLIVSCIPYVGWWLGPAVGATVTTGLGLAEHVGVGRSIIEGAITFAVVYGIHAEIASQLESKAGLSSLSSGSAGTVGDKDREKPGGGAQVNQGADYPDKTLNQTTNAYQTTNDNTDDLQLNQSLSSDSIGNIVVGNTLQALQSGNFIKGANTEANAALFYSIMKQGVGEFDNLARGETLKSVDYVQGFFDNHPRFALNVDIAAGFIYTGEGGVSLNHEGLVAHFGHGPGLLTFAGGVNMSYTGGDSISKTSYRLNAYIGEVGSISGSVGRGGDHLYYSAAGGVGIGEKLNFVKEHEYVIASWDKIRNWLQ